MLEIDAKQYSHKSCRILESVKYINISECIQNIFFRKKIYMFVFPVFHRERIYCAKKLLLRYKFKKNEYSENFLN